MKITFAKSIPESSKRVLRPFKISIWYLVLALAVLPFVPQRCMAQNEYLAGYLIIPIAEKVERTYNA
ncbi:MAG: hypothetical protein NT023_19425, partial [Armatimonadetes bacterium]|nr:hypothetical protein [Armatimonadota bacterium]